MPQEKITEIHEIMERSEQGMTRPFICRGDDGNVYFVKGKGAGRRSLICEWIAGRLGQQLGLPIAPFRLVKVPEALIEFGSRSDLSELGIGYAFGSARRPLVELTVSHIIQVPRHAQMDVLAFDWWVRNGDRTLGARGGNPNLFWEVEKDSLLVLDHNQAFDPDFDKDTFAQLHPFRDCLPHLFEDLFSRNEYGDRFELAMAQWDTICDTVPHDWWFLDEERTLPVEFDLAATKARLLDCHSDEFWRLK